MFKVRILSYSSCLVKIVEDPFSGVHDLLWLFEGKKYTYEGQIEPLVSMPFCPLTSVLIHHKGGSTICLLPTITERTRQNSNVECVMKKKCHYHRKNGFALWKFNL